MAGVKKTYVLSVFACFFILSACAPFLSTYPENAVVLSFSSDVWGGTDFDETLKKKVFAEALKSKSTRRLERLIPFESSGKADIKLFRSYYEVDASKFPPLIGSGYELIIVPNGETNVRLTNKRTGLSWRVSLGL